MRIQIIGYGIVGGNMHKVFKDADIFDPDKGYTQIPENRYDVAFVCVPTPMKEDGSCDTSIVESVINKHNPTVFCIRSTIPPGTTEKLQKRFNKPCVFSPEYYGSTIHANAYDYNFIILGGDDVYRRMVASAFMTVYHGGFKYRYTTSRTAEMVKFMENCGLAARVSLCNEFKSICDVSGIDYNEAKELWLEDPRFNRSHTLVYDDAPGWNSICFNKDIPAMIEYSKSMGIKTPILDSIMKYKR